MAGGGAGAKGRENSEVSRRAFLGWLPYVNLGKQSGSGTICNLSEGMAGAVC
jgi:hypothetical protein